MTDKPFQKSDWVEMLRATGLDETQMHRWHGIFEDRWPDAHQSFLEWLGIGAAEIGEIRERSRSEWK